MDDPFADVAVPAPAAADPFADVAQPAPVPSAPGVQFGQLQSRLQAAPAAQEPTPADLSGYAIANYAATPPPQTDRGRWDAIGAGALNAYEMGGRGLLGAWDMINHGLDAALPGVTGDALETSRDYATKGSQAVGEAIAGREAANQAHTGLMRTTQTVTSFPQAVLPPLMATTAGGSRYQDIQDRGGTEAQAQLGGLADFALNAAIPEVAHGIGAAVSPLAGKIAGGLTEAIGRGAATRVAGAGIGAAENAAMLRAQDVGEAGISYATGDPERAKEELAGDPNALLGISALGAALGFRGHGALSGAKPEEQPFVSKGGPGMVLSPEEVAHFNRKTDPFADVAVDQTIGRARPGEAISNADETNLRPPDDRIPQPTPEAVAADSTPEADAAFSEDPLRANNPEGAEEIGKLGRIGGTETEVDMSPIEANRRALEAYDRAQMETTEHPPVEDPQVETPTEQVEPIPHPLPEDLGESGEHAPLSSEQDNVGESGPQEPVAADGKGMEVNSKGMENTGEIPPADGKGMESGAAGPDYSHLSPEAQAFLRGEIATHPQTGKPIVQPTPENVAHKIVQDTIAERKTANDRAGDFGNVAEAVGIAQNKIDRATKLAAKGLKPEAPLGKPAAKPATPEPKSSPAPEVAPKEPAPKAGDNFAVGDKVSIFGRPGEITVIRPNGVHTVRYEDGTRGHYTKEAMDYSAKKAPAQPAAKPADEAPTERDLKPVEGKPQAPGDRANPEPRLSLKGEDGQVRDAERVLLGDRVQREPVPQEPLRQEARDVVAKEGHEAAAKRLLEKSSRKEAWTQDEYNQAIAVRDHFIRNEGLGQRTRELQEAMNAHASAGGAFLANLRDRVQTPEARYMEAHGVASTATAGKAKILQNLLQEQAQDKAEHTRANRNAPLKADGPSEAPAAKALKSTSAEKKAKLDAELPKLIEDFKRALRAPNSNLLAGRQAEALYNLLENRVKAGVHSFVDLVKSLKKDVPDVASNKDIQESVEQGWERLRQDHPAMGEGGRVDPTLRGIDYEARAQAVERRMAARDKKIEAIRSGIEKDAADLQKYLKKRGYDLDDPNAEWLKDPNRFGDFLAHVDAAKGGIPAVIGNGYIGALHASFGIPAVKAVTDADAMIGDAIVRNVEGLVRIATFRPNAVAELKAFWKAAPGAAVQGLKNAVESTAKERAIGPGSEHEVFGAPSPFTVKMGLAGTILRHASMLPLVRGINSGAMTYAAMTDAAAWAVRSAKGLKGKELEDHVQSEISNQQSNSWKHAIEHAQSLTQTTPLGITNWISRLKHSQDTHVAVRVAARVLAPFVTIPTNVALSALRRLPVTGDIAAVSRLLDYKEGSVHFHPEKLTHETARALLRWGLYGLASSYLFGNDKEGKARVSGYAPQGHDYKGDGVFTHAPHSLTLFGKTFDLNRLGIVGKALSGMKDFHDGKLKEGIIEAGKEEALARPFMDLYYANKFGEAGWGAYVANHFPIPSFMGQLGRAFEDKEKLSYNPANEGNFWAALADTAKARAGFNTNPDVKLGGQSVEKPAFEDSPILTRIYRLLTPSQLGHSDEFYQAKGKKIVKNKVH